MWKCSCFLFVDVLRESTRLLDAYANVMQPLSHSVGILRDPSEQLSCLSLYLSLFREWRMVLLIAAANVRFVNEMRVL